MPTYTYFCQTCNGSFDLNASINSYKEKQECPSCNEICDRDYNDMLTLSSSVVKSDSELRTVGDLANRNRDKLTADQKADLDRKHTQYQDDKVKDELTKELPKGMSRIAKPKYKPKWR